MTNKLGKIGIIAFVCSMLVASLLLPLSSCANRGIGPQGGPVDSLAPVITKMTIPNGARNVKEKKMTIQFNEYISINGSTENILVSPPQQRPPEIKAVGKKLEIEFQEDLLDSTTYTIDFGDQIVDNNEKNPVKGYAYSFSTGDHIDSLEVYGQLINAEDLNPISGIVIGLHQDMEDSAFYKHPFTRIARTNAEGEFAIRNVKTGTYRLYALQDQSRDYCFQPGEGLAFMDETVTPYIITEVEQDTIYMKDTLDAMGRAIPDSVITSEYFYYEPSNLLLRYFAEDYKRLYFQRMIRKNAHMIQLNFGGSQPAMPQLQAMRLESDSLAQDSMWVDFIQYSILQANATMDTFRIWLTDSLAIRMDTIRFAMTYTKTDSAFQNQWQTDTILATYKAPKLNDRTRKTMEQKRIKMGLTLQCLGSKSFNHFDTLLLASSTPIQTYYVDSMHLFMKQDTTLVPVDFTVQKKDETGMELMVQTSWHAGSDYVLKTDSGAVTDIYGMSTKQDKYAIHVRSNEEYANMTVHIQPFTEKAVIQILDGQDKPIRTARAAQGGTRFQYMDAGTYYMRIFMDENGDGKWTTGELKSHRQPEQVYYFQKKMTLRANWEFEEHFDWQMIPLLQQKPAAIRKDLGAQKK